MPGKKRAAKVYCTIFVVTLVIYIGLSAHIIFTDLAPFGIYYMIFPPNINTTIKSISPPIDPNTTKGNNPTNVVSYYESLYPKIYEPISKLLITSVGLHLYSTKVLFTSYDILRGVELIEKFESQDTAASFREFRNSLHLVGETTNAFLGSLDPCLELFTYDSDQFSYAGIVAENDERNLYYDAFQKCQSAQATWLSLYTENLGLQHKFDQLKSNVIESLEAARDFNTQSTFFDKLRPQGRLNMHKEGVYDYWLKYFRDFEDEAKIDYAIYHVEATKDPLEEVVNFLKVANGEQVPHSKAYQYLVTKSRPLFTSHETPYESVSIPPETSKIGNTDKLQKMLAYSYAMGGRKYKIGS